MNVEAVKRAVNEAFAILDAALLMAPVRTRKRLATHAVAELLDRHVVPQEEP